MSTSATLTQTLQERATVGACPACSHPFHATDELLEIGGGGLIHDRLQCLHEITRRAVDAMTETEMRRFLDAVPVRLIVMVDLVRRVPEGEGERE